MEYMTGRDTHGVPWSLVSDLNHSLPPIKNLANTRAHAHVQARVHAHEVHFSEFLAVL